MNEWNNEWMNEWMDEWDGWMDERIMKSEWIDK